MNPTYVTENEIQKQRLLKVTARLTSADFTQPMPNGWTVHTKLTHLAFWDMYYLSCIEEWERTGFVAFRVNVDVINETVRALSHTIPHDSVIELVREATAAIDRKVARLSPGLASTIDAAGYERILHRARHRSEHLDQIEEALRS